MEKNLFKGLGVEVDILDQDNFLKIKETLTRIGISSKKSRTLFQSCHILHKKDKIDGKSRYAILHFKELFALDGKLNSVETSDIGRRNTITNLLEEWGLVKILNPSVTEDPIEALNRIKIISYKEKDSWELESKYTVGNKKG